MEAIYACSIGDESRSTKAGTAVCFVLDSAHANHTIRVFLRDQGPGAVVRPISAEEAWRLIEPISASARNDDSKTDASR